jgi:undecaprenyl-diphosphatase
VPLAWAVVLGLAQGLTEFLPVSSSAHLTLLPWFFGFKDPGLAFDIALHAGSLVAIVVALRSDWVELARGLVRPGRTFEKRLALFLVITSVPGAVVGYLLEDEAATVFRNPLLVAATLVGFGLVLWAVDRFIASAEPIESMTGAKALLIGLAQAFAIVPGVSRSGATMTAGRALGLSRESAARYSFMAALPIIFGATVFGLRHMSLAALPSADWVLGFAASAISSFFAMRLLLAYVRKRSFAVFLYYRLALSAAVVAVAILRG